MVRKMNFRRGIQIILNASDAKRAPVCTVSNMKVKIVVAILTNERDGGGIRAAQANEQRAVNDLQERTWTAS